MTDKNLISVIVVAVTLAFSVNVTAQLHVADSGKVGIGTSTPDYLLEVEQFATEPTIAVHNTGSNGGATFRFIDDLSGADFKFKSTMYGGFKIRDHGHSQDVFTIESQSAATHAIYVDSNGNVGIGATTGTIATALSVNGTVEARDFNVTSSSVSWPDYVFKDAYQLKSLEEIEIYTKTNHRLPGVPSEKEIAENGINIGEITVIQMEKIEELTLYMIALQKENKTLSDRVRSLEEQL